MTNQEILSKLANVKKGRYFSFKKRKNLGHGIEKQSEMVIRLGIAYANMNVNANKQTGPLPWGHWVEGFENLVIEHKGNYYLRVTSTDPEHLDSGADIINTTYLQNGTEISKEQALAIVGENKMKSSPSTVYNVKFENIISVGA